MLLQAVVLFLVSIFLVFLKNKLGFFGSSTEKLPPGPNTWQVLRKVSELRKEPHIAFTNLAKTYGPIMSLRLGGQVLIVASSAATAMEICKTQDKAFSGRFLPLVYYKIPSAEQSSVGMSKDCNATWKFLRGMGQSFIFSPKSVESKSDMRKLKVMEMVEYLKRKQGQIVKLDDLMNFVMFNIISDILVSRNVFDLKRDHDHHETNDENTRALVNEVVAMVASAVGLPDLFPFLKRFDFRIETKAMEIHRKLVYIWEAIVKERRSQRLLSNNNSNNNNPRDFLDVLIDNSLTDDQIYVNFTELMIAGSDSTSITLVWLMAELIRNPLVLRRVVEEVAKAFQGDDIDESVLSESRYLQACIKETLRIHIPGPFLIPHRAIEACKIHDYTFPKDSIVVVNAWAISLDPDNWDDANSFNPDRFLIEGSKIDYRGKHFEFIPFGAGRRMCPGYNVAFKNIQIVVASLLHYFDWGLPNGADPTQIDMNAITGTVLKKETPLLLIPTLRS